MKRKKKLQPVHLAAIAAAASFLVVFIVYAGIQAEPALPRSVRPSYHAHADFLVVINGRQMDFSKQEYEVADPSIHLHLRNFAGDRVLHIESREATLGDFFSSLGMELSGGCFFTESAEYCSDGQQRLSFFVNGKMMENPENYMPEDMDRMLVIYGNYTDEETKTWIDSVTSYACIFSLKCSPPEEAENRVIYN